MQDIPLTTAANLRHASTVHGAAEVSKTSVGKFDKKAIRALHGAGSLNVVTIK